MLDTEGFITEPPSTPRVSERDPTEGLCAGPSGKGCHLPQSPIVLFKDVSQDKEITIPLLILNDARVIHIMNMNS